MDVIIGLLIIAIGAFCQSSCYVPINKIKNLLSVGLKGFTNCDSKNKCTGHKYTAVFAEEKNNK